MVKENPEIRLRDKMFEEVEECFLATMEAAQVGIFVVQDFRFKYVNAFLLKACGYTAEELLDEKGPLDLIAPEQHAFVVQQMNERAQGVPGQRYELFAVRKDGSTFPVSIQSATSHFNGMPASVGTVFDISEQKAAEERIRELANYDALTGLPNRRLFHDRMAQMLAVAQREETSVALLFIDLDHFKRINDSLGHSVGDELLCALAGRLEHLVRRGDTIARLGGDEFVIAMPDVNATVVAEVARRLLDECCTPFMIAGHELTVTPSAGISLYPQDGEDIEALLKNADSAMYQAKEIGRNTFQFYRSEMNTVTLERLMMESALRRALKNREFILSYQPLVCLKSGRIVGVEALIRWRHPDLGMIMPDRFIPLAEENGLINPIGDWVLNEACRQGQAWIEAGLPPMTMAVNVAPVQFRQSGFLEAVAGALSVSGFDAASLELEVTERTVMHDAEINLGALSALHRMGVQISLDDFGTGYSSLAYLKRFPVGKLKIDRSFIHDMESDPDDRAIASTIVSVGRNLRLSVLAEGVESATQLDYLRQMGCDLAQGYFFARPLPPEEITELLRAQPFLNQE